MQSKEMPLPAVFFVVAFFTFFFVQSRVDSAVRAAWNVVDERGVR